MQGVTVKRSTLHQEKCRGHENIHLSHFVALLVQHWMFVLFQCIWSFIFLCCVIPISLCPGKSQITFLYNAVKLLETTNQPSFVKFVLNGFISNIATKVLVILKIFVINLMTNPVFANCALPTHFPFVQYLMTRAIFILT